MAVFLYDTFTDTNGKNLVGASAHVGETGATWTSHPSYSNTGSIFGNRAAVGGQNVTVFYSSGTPGSPDYTVTGRLYVVTNDVSHVGVVSRMSTSASLWYSLTYDGTKFTIYKNASAELGSRTVSVTVGESYDMTLDTSGSGTVSLKARVQRVSDGQWLNTSGNWQSTQTDCVTVNDSSSPNNSAGRAGLWLTTSTSSTGRHIDSITANDTLVVGGGDETMSGGARLSGAASVSGGAPASAVIEVVASTIQRATNGTAPVTTTAINTTGANLIVLSLIHTNSQPTVTDSYGNLWTPLTALGSSQVSRLFYCVNPTVGPGHTFTATQSLESYPVLGVLAVSGASDTPFDVENGSTGNSTSLQPGNITPTQDGSLVVTALANGVGTNAAINGGYTALTSDFVNAAAVGGSFAYLIQNSAAQTNPTWTWNSGGASSAAIASFKSASGVSGPFVASGGVHGAGTATVSGGNTSGPVTVSVTDTNLFFSPYNWYKSGSTYAQTNNPGAYFKTKFTGTSVKLNVDVSPLSGAGTSAGNYPAIQYSIDGGAFTRRQLLSSDTQITLASSLSAGTHTLEVHVVAAWWQADRWNTPVSVVRVTGLELDQSASTVAPDLFSGRMIIYGDSNSEGYESLAVGVSVANQDANQAFPVIMGRAFSCEYGVVGFAGQGYTAGGGGNVPNLQNAWDDYYSGQSRLSGGLFSPAPDYIVSAHGQNDGSPRTAVAALIPAWRAAAPNAKILICIPANQNCLSTITQGVADADDENTHIINFGENLLRGSYVHSNHLNVRGHALFAATLARQAENALWPTTSELAEAVWTYNNRTLS